MIEPKIELALKQIESKAERLDVTMRKGETATVMAYQTGVFLAELKRDLQRVRTL